MHKCSLVVSLSPLEVIEKLKEEEGAEFVYEEFHKIENGKNFGTLIFEKYFIRVMRSVSLVVLVNNISGKTVVNTVATGSPKGLISLDWGAGDNFAKSIKEIFTGYIVEEITENIKSGKIKK